MPGAVGQMLVKDLMEALGQMPPDAQVVYEGAHELAGITSIQLIDDAPLINTVLLTSTTTRIEGFAYPYRADQDGEQS